MYMYLFYIQIAKIISVPSLNLCEIHVKTHKHVCMFTDTCINICKASIIYSSFKTLYPIPHVVIKEDPSLGEGVPLGQGEVWRASLHSTFK